MTDQGNGFQNQKAGWEIWTPGYDIIASHLLKLPRRPASLDSCPFCLQSLRREWLAMLSCQDPFIKRLRKSEGARTT